MCMCVCTCAYPSPLFSPTWQRISEPFGYQYTGATPFLAVSKNSNYFVCFCMLITYGWEGACSMWCGSGSVVLAVCRILLCGHHCFFNTPPPPIDHLGFPGGTRGKESPASARDIRDVGLIPGSRRSPGKGNGNYSSIIPFIFIFWPHHLACGILVSQPGIEPTPPTLEAESHWTARAVLFS